eukprot:Phypoly_transcript_14047.p1 GENE.Phypoly_transcript_14047~~Phypoly_transcript_14047.p1  ORF type:complete len:316 (+),score=40.32 Phypoly_transcript_14047:143-949(+)
MDGSGGVKRMEAMGSFQPTVVVICFDVTNRSSFEEVPFWRSEIERHFPTLSRFVLVALKVDLVDLRKASGDPFKDLPLERKVSDREAIRMARSIGAGAYVECSGLTQYGTRQVWHEVAKVALPLYFPAKDTKKPASGRSFFELLGFSKKSEKTIKISGGGKLVKSNNILENLVPDLRNYLCRFLEPEDLLKMQIICKNWNFIVPGLWPALMEASPIFIKNAFEYAKRSDVNLPIKEFFRHMYTKDIVVSLYTQQHTPLVPIPPSPFPS